MTRADAAKALLRAMRNGEDFATAQARISLAFMESASQAEWDAAMRDAWALEARVSK